MSQESLVQLSTVPWFLVSAPETRSKDILRDELSQAFEASVRDYPLTVIEAPSGFGKTTALALWSRHRDAPTAWITLNRDTDSPAQLLAYVMGALMHIYPDSAELESVMAHMQDDLADLQSSIGSIIDAVPDGQTTIIIDEIQESSREAVKALIVPLGRHSRGRIRFVLSGTQSVARWLTKEIAKGQAHHISSMDLLFTPEEVSQLLSRHTKSAFTVAEQLWQETGGWPVAVRLLLQIGADRHTPAELWESVNPGVLTEYIRTEVLDTLRPELRQFILDAVVCERLNPSLASYMVDSPHAAALLDECRTQGLFLDRFNLDGKPVHYHWHTTFAHSCREIAERTDPERFHMIHRRAAEWMAERYPAEAIHHAIQTNDTDFAVRLIEHVWMQLITSGRSVTLETRCLQLPSSADEHASSLYVRAVCRDMADDHSGALMLKARADRASAFMTGEPAERTAITRTFAELMILSDHAKLESALDRAEEILVEAQLHRSQQIHGTFLAGWTRIRLRSKPERAIELLKHASESAAKAGYDMLSRRAAATSGFALSFAGHLNMSRKILNSLSASEKSGQGYDPFDGTMNYLSSTFTSYWQGDMAGAIADARRLDSTGARFSSNAAMGRIYFACAAALADRDLLDEAEELLSRVSDDVQHGVPWPAYKAVASASLYWARGNRSAAVRALDVLGHHSGITTTLAMAADLWRRLGYPDQALRVLDRIEPSLLVSYTTASMRFTQAVIAWDRGKPSDAHSLLELSLDAAIPESINAPYTCLDDSARSLLVAHLDWGTRYERFVADRLGGNEMLVPVSPSALLSQRESEVLRYLATTMSPIEIAEALFLSPATVRSHQRSIYRKLNVTTRRDAVRAGLHG